MVDKEIRNLLDEWDFSSFVGTFQDNGIDADAFRFLTVAVETIKELIPKVGPRLKFISCWNTYKEKECINDGHKENDNSEINKYIIGDTPKDIDIICEDFGNASTSTVSVTSNSPIISNMPSNYQKLETRISQSTEAGAAFQEATKQSYGLRDHLILKKRVARSTV